MLGFMSLIPGKVPWCIGSDTGFLATTALFYSLVNNSYGGKTSQENRAVTKVGGHSLASGGQPQKNIFRHQYQNMCLHMTHEKTLTAASLHDWK